MKLAKTINRFEKTSLLLDTDITPRNRNTPNSTARGIDCRITGFNNRSPGNILVRIEEEIG